MVVFFDLANSHRHLSSKVQEQKLALLRGIPVFSPNYSIVTVFLVEHQLDTYSKFSFILKKDLVLKCFSKEMCKDSHTLTFDLRGS